MPLPEPVGRQREVLTLPTTGHFVVLGTAGSGKTTLAIHRAAYLANPALPGNGKTLLVTFNNALVAYLRHLGAGSRNVQVETYHRFARGYLASVGHMGYNSILDATPREALIENARKSVLARHAGAAVLARPAAFFSREIQWIQQNGIETVDEYVRAERVGQAAVRVDRAARPHVFEVLVEYQRQRQQFGKQYDWDDLANAVLRYLQSDEQPRRYQHVVIDEGQDFSPAMLRSLAAAIPPSGSLTFFGDAAQQIYGTGVSWKSAGLRVRPSEVWFFTENYRNTREIAALAIAISEMPYYEGVADLVAPTLPRAAGPPPGLAKFADRGAELRFIYELAQSSSRAQSVAILLRNRASEDRLSVAFKKQATRLHRDLPLFSGEAGLYYGTIHSAKGLEFDTVIIPFLDELSSDPDDVAALGENEALTQAGKLLYVGVTRCRLNLVMTQVGTNTNPLMPVQQGLYTVADR